jgi:hypothetical protein
MKKCPLCDKEFKVLPQHLTAIHSIKKPVYSHLYEILTDDSIENLYNKGMSASQIESGKKLIKNLIENNL